MTARLLLVTGKGGVGKTTVAAATAVTLARSGHRTLVVSLDAAHSLGDVLDVTLGTNPTAVEPGLHAVHVDTRRLLEERWRGIQEYLVALLDEVGFDTVEAEELTVLPGAEELLALLEVRAFAEDGAWDDVVVDFAPTAETLRLLAMPEAVRRYLHRVLPPDRRVARALRPVLLRTAAMPVPSDAVLAAVDRLADDLVAVRALLVSGVTEACLVLTPESVVLAETRRAYTALTLHGVAVGSVVVNRLVPPGPDPWRTSWVARQAEVLAEVRASFSGIDVHEAPYGDAEPVGADALARLAAAFDATARGADSAPQTAGARPDELQVDRVGDELVLRLPVPFTESREIDLTRVGDDLAVTVGSNRRVLALPAALRRCTVEGAACREGVLSVRFRPDPDRWTRT
jgi:arsenite-transporting ATPase